MNEKDFSDLLESVKEVGLTEREDSVIGREFVAEKRLDIDSSNLRTFAICLSNEDENLVPFKLYHVVLQPGHGTCTAKDENNETTVFPIGWFLPVEFPSKIERLLEEKELALS